MVECQHCHGPTPVDGSKTTDKIIGRPPRNPKTPYNTPARADNEMISNTSDEMGEQTHLQRKILDAAIETATTASEPTFLYENKHNIFALCGALPKPPKKGKDGKPIPPKLGEDGKPAPSKNIKKITKMLTDKPGLLRARSANMESLGLPTGFTVLHAACHAGNEEVVEYLLNNHVFLLGEEEEESRPMLDLNVVDLQGRTALHVAAEKGHIEVVNILKRAYDAVEEGEKQLLENEEINSGSSEGATDGEGLAEKMEKLSTSDSSTQMTPPTDTTAMATPKTPKSRSPMRRRTPKTPKSRSPMPPPSSRSPKFAGPEAPIDLSGRTPLGCAATSPVPKAKKNRSELEKVLYKEGDRSIVGERTPPNARCGPRGRIFSPPPAGSGRRVSFGGEEGGDGGIVSGTNSFLSPPRSHQRRHYSTPGGSGASSNFATPLEVLPEEKQLEAVNHGDKAENALQLQWGASEINGWRVDMEDQILVKYELYGDRERVPPKPPTLDNESTAANQMIPTMGLFGVFDGHGDGGFASHFIATNLEGKLKSQPDWPLAYHSCNTSYKHLTKAWTEACNELDEDLKNDKEKPKDGGTTAIMALVSGRYMFVANVGDSRCILVKKRKDEKEEVGDNPCWELDTLEVIPLSEDHKPDLPEERARIESAGLTVQTDHVPPDDGDEDGEYTTVHRVKKSDMELLGVARAFGDYDYKLNGDLSPSRQAVVCTPDIVVRERADAEDMYLVLACDGIWDVMSNEDVGAFVSRRVAELLDWVPTGASDEKEQSGERSATALSNNSDLPNKSVQGEILASVGDDLLAECLRQGSRDNMSVLIISFKASGLTTSVGAVTSSLPAREGDEKKELPDDGTVRTLEYE